MKRKTTAEGWSWGLLLGATATLVLLVTVPLIFIAPRADHRFNPYRWGGEYRLRPWRLVGDQFSSIDKFLSSGNFRPFGRILERALDLFAYSIATGLNAPMHFGLRVSHVLAMMVFSIVSVLVTQMLTNRGAILNQRPSLPASVVAVSLPVLLVSAGNSSAITLFADLYFYSGTLVLLTAVLTSKDEWQVARGLSPVLALTSLLFGAFLASFNEVAYLALPLGYLVSGLRNWALYWRGPSEYIRSRSFLALSTSFVGFLAVLIPIRLVISDRCSTGGCYVGSEIDVGWNSLPTVWHRLSSANPHAVWGAATDGVSGLWFLTSNPFLIGLAFACIVVVYRTIGPAWDQESNGTGSRELVAVLLFGIGLALAGGLMAGVSAFVQSHVASTWPVGSGWRDAQFLAGAWAMIAAALIAALNNVSARGFRATARLVLASACIVSMLANETVAKVVSQDPASDLHVRIATELAMVSERMESVDRRCSVLLEFRELHPDRQDWHRRLEAALDSAVQERIGSTFCPKPR